MFHTQTKFIEASEVAQIASKMPNLTRGVWLLMNDTGLRVSDAVRVKYGDIDSHGFLHYIAKKTGKPGMAKLTDAFLHEYVCGLNKSKRYKNEYIFNTKVAGKRKPVSRSTVFRHIKNACKACNIDASGIAPHSARKSFAVRDFREYGLGRVMHDLQHRDASTTLLYAMSDNAMPILYGRIKDLEEKVQKLSEKWDSELEEIAEKLDILFMDTRGDTLNIKITEKSKKSTKKSPKKQK